MSIPKEVVKKRVESSILPPAADVHFRMPGPSPSDLNLGTEELSKIQREGEKG